MQTRRDVFQALADPNRRRIIDLLAVHPLSVNAVAARFDISRPAISRHMRILEECGLVKIEKHGRERWCRASLESLSEVEEWIAQSRRFWNESLDKLENILANHPD